MIPQADSPGVNTHLKPERTPEWLRPVVDAITSDAIPASLRRELTFGRAPSARRASVLMLFTGTSLDDAAVLLLHRSPSLRSHSGQIAFPGGRVDPEDMNNVDAALREAWEETGLDRTSVTPLAELDEVHIRATGYPVYPVLAYWDKPHEVRAMDPAETDEVFVIPLAQLIDPKVRFKVNIGPWAGPAFNLNGYLLWGFTAGLLDIMFRHAGWEIPWDHSNVIPLEDALARSRNDQVHS